MSSEIKSPKEFVDAILSACDASNWDADGHKGDYFRGLYDAYEAIHEIAIDYQVSMYGWTSADVGQLTKQRDTLALALKLANPSG